MYLCTTTANYFINKYFQVLLLFLCVDDNGQEHRLHCQFLVFTTLSTALLYRSYSINTWSLAQYLLTHTTDSLKQLLKFTAFQEVEGY